MSIKRFSTRLLITGLTLVPGATALAQDLPFTSTAVTEFNSPWAMEFLPDGRMLVTEKGGTLQLVTQDGEKTEVDGVPSVTVTGQGGLGDIVLHPDFESNGVVYLSYVESGDGRDTGAVVARGTLDLDAAALEGMEVIWRAEPKLQAGLHYSYRMVFDDEGHLFVTAGERNHNSANPENAPGQALDNHLGKVHRLNDDGTAAAGNPFADEDGALDSIWSIGHRNLLGIAFDTEGRLWNTEMGPRGGDELNLVIAGNNYGYPWVSNGDHYNGDVIPDHDTRPEFEAPKAFWNPSISPGSLMIYSGDKFADWYGNAFVGALGAQGLIRLELGEDSATKADQWSMGARIREVEQGPDGYIWILEDGGSGRLLKLTP